MASFNLAIMAWGIGSDELMTDTKLQGGLLKKGLYLSSAVGKPVGKLETIVGLNAFYDDTPALKPENHFVEKIRRGIGGLLRIGTQKAQTGKLIDSGVLKKP